MQVTIGKQRFWYEVHGERGTPVVLIMGFGISGRAWAPQVSELSRRHRVLIFDNRGIGSSDPSRTSYGFADLATDTAAIMDHVGFARAHVVGVSMGGMIAQHLALLDPARLKSLTLIASLPGGGLRHLVPRPRALALFLRANTSRGATRFAALRRLLYTPHYLSQQERPEDGFSRTSLDVFATPASPKTALNQLRAVLRHDVVQRLREMRVPTLVVKPEDDLLVRPHNSERLHALIAGSRIERLRGAGHGVTHERAHDVNSALLDHFARNEADGTSLPCIERLDVAAATSST